MDPSAQSANVFGNDNIVVQAIDSIVNVTVGPKPYLRLTQYERRTKLAARDNSEAALLSAYRDDVVSLIGRDSALADLRAWLASEAPVSVRVLVGPGGRGKTRLALELTRSVAKEGWLAGFATTEELDRFRGQNGVEQWRWEKPVLIILDYAASRAEQLRDWVRELIDASLEDRPKLRLLLLERQANRTIGWLASVFGQGDNDDSRAAIALLDPKEPVELPALGELDLRRQVFAALLGHANAALTAPATGADPEFDRLLGDRKWAGDPLYLMMAGLTAAETGVKGALGLSRADLALSIGRKELDRIGRIAATRGVDDKHQIPGAFLRHMAAIATLLQGLTLTEARVIATKEIDTLRSGADLNATIGALQDALPGPDAVRGVAPILPDIVGEGAILDWFGPNGGLATSGVDAAERMMAAARPSVGKAAETLVRAAQDFAEAGRAEPIQWLAALAGAPETDLGALIEIASALPHSTVVLRELSTDLFRRIADILRGAATTGKGAGADEQILAYSLDNLGVRLSALGRNEEAVAAAQDAVDISRNLASARPDAFLPALANSLSNLGAFLVELRRRKEALAAAQEAVDIGRRLAAARSDVSLPDFARWLASLANVLSESDRSEDALAAAREAIDIRRRLAAGDPDAFLPDLALSLSNFGSLASDPASREGLAATQEAVDIHRRLAAVRPDAFQPELALSLNNLSNHLSNFGRRDDALAAAKEAVDIRRRLAAARPEPFLPDLALSLNNLSNHLSDLGRREDALAAAREATDIYRRLAAARPDAYLPDLARSLTNLGDRLSKLDRRDEALAAAREAVDICRPLAAARPDAFLPDLAQSLNDVGAFLGNLERNEEALAPTREAVEIRRRLAAARPDVFQRDLAQSLQNLGIFLIQLGRREEALAAAQEAAGIFRSLAAVRPNLLPDFAQSLHNLVSVLSGLGRRDEALKAAQETADIYRRLNTARPDGFRSDLALSLQNLSDALNALGRGEEALAAAQEAGEIAFSLDSLGQQLSADGRREDALAAAQEAVLICRHLASWRPDIFLPHLAPLLDNLGNHLSNVGRTEEALAAAQGATEIYRRLAAARPDAFLADFALSLNNLSQTYKELNRPEDALAARREAVVTLAPLFVQEPAAHAQWMTMMVRNYLELSEKLGVQPDAALLGPIAEAFDKLPSSSDGAESKT